jgi:ATP-dependent Lhr-like helicase
MTRLRQTLERIQQSRILILDTQHLTPLAFPIWAESIRTQHISSESWNDRVKRMVVMLEREAGKTSNRQNVETSKQRGVSNQAPATG